MSGGLLKESPILPRPHIGMLGWQPLPMWQWDSQSSTFCCQKTTSALAKKYASVIDNLGDPLFAGHPGAC